MKTVHSQRNSSTGADDRTDLTLVQVFYFEQFVLKISVLSMTLCVTIATNLTDGLLINYTRIGRAFNKLSEKYIYFYILTLLIMAVVFDFLLAVTEY